MKIYIPSYKRRKITTLRLWPEGLPVQVVVQHQERKHYERILSERGLRCAELLVMPRKLDECGLARTRDFIFDATGDEDCAQLDDDLYFYRRGKVAKDPLLLRNLEPEEHAGMFKLLETWLAEPELAQVGIGMREGHKMSPELFYENRRCCRAAAFKMSVVNRLKYRCRIGSKDDLDATLVLLRAGYKNRISMHYAQGQTKSDKYGGCSVYRTEESMMAACRKLVEKHPGLVDVVQIKGRKGGTERWRNRIDVRIHWQKAFGYDARFRVPSLV